MGGSGGRRGRGWWCDMIGQSEIACAASRGAMVMDSIRLRNFRCFRDVKYARLAPLTLLVGENSAGKTSFMAMARILSDISAGSETPDFRREPYDLGGFDEIAYRDKSYRAKTFEAGFDAALPAPNLGESESARYRVDVTFGKRGTTPVPVRRRFSLGDASAEYLDDAVNSQECAMASSAVNTFAAAPVRAKPRRAYDPKRLIANPEGDHVPAYLSELRSQNGEMWATIKRPLEKFGQESGLFDEIRINDLGDNGRGPFQIRVRKSGQRA